MRTKNLRQRNKFVAGKIVKIVFAYTIFNLHVIFLICMYYF